MFSSLFLSFDLRVCIFISFSYFLFRFFIFIFFFIYSCQHSWHISCPVGLLPPCCRFYFLYFCTFLYLKPLFFRWHLSLITRCVYFTYCALQAAYNHCVWRLTVLRTAVDAASPCILHLPLSRFRRTHASRLSVDYIHCRNSSTSPSLYRLRPRPYWMVVG